MCGAGVSHTLLHKHSCQSRVCCHFQLLSFILLICSKMADISLSISSPAGWSENFPADLTDTCVYRASFLHQQNTGDGSRRQRANAFSKSSTNWIQHLVLLISLPVCLLNCASDLPQKTEQIHCTRAPLYTTIPPGCTFRKYCFMLTLRKKRHKQTSSVFKGWIKTGI